MISKQRSIALHLAAGARALLLVGLVTLTGCDRTPTDTASDKEPGSTMLSESWEASGFAASSTSLAHLLRSAVARLEKEQGGDASRRLLANWRELQEEARAAVRAGQRVDARARIAAIRAEEIGIVLLALGDPGTQRVIAAVRAAHGQLRIELAKAETAGKNVMRARELAVPVSDLLQRANRARQAGDAARALDFATQASDRLDDVSHFLIALHRIPALETLFAEVIAEAGRERGQDRVAGMLVTLNQRNVEARSAMVAGDRAGATRKLEAARREQIRIVLELRGNDVVGTLIERIDAGIASTRLRFDSLEPSRLVEHAQRMLAEASDLKVRARQLQLRGDHGGALDLASHAAGLVNAIQHLLPR